MSAEGGISKEMNSEEARETVSPLPGRSLKPNLLSPQNGYTCHSVTMKTAANAVFFTQRLSLACN